MRQAVTISDAAYSHLEAMLRTAPEGAKAIFLSLKNAGCAGVAYKMDFISDINPKDERVDYKNITLIIEAKSLLFLLGMHIDYKVDTLKSGFVFENPNQTDACGCGESVKLEAAPSIP